MRPSLTFEHIHETFPFAMRPIAKLAIFVVTRGPHSAVALQHHAVVIACCDRLGACAHDRWRNRVGEGHGTGGEQGEQREACVCVRVCVFVCARTRVCVSLCVCIA